MPADVSAGQPTPSPRILKPCDAGVPAPSGRLQSYVVSVALAAGLGSLAAFAFAPYFILPFTFVGFAGFVILLRRARSWRSGFLFGWAFGLGHFLLGLNWITESFKVEAETLGALAWPAVVGLCAFLAVFPAVAAAATRAFGAAGQAPIVAFAPLWTLAEMARGTVLSGFPWNLAGYVWGISDETLQLASLLGIYGLSLITLSLSSLPLLVATRNSRRLHSAFFALSMVCLGATSLWGIGALRLARAANEVVPAVQLRLVQANISQEAKWDPDEASEILARYIRMSGAHRDLQFRRIYFGRKLPFRSCSTAVRSWSTSSPQPFLRQARLLSAPLDRRRDGRTRNPPCSTVYSCSTRREGLRMLMTR